MCVLACVHTTVVRIEKPLMFMVDVTDSYLFYTRISFQFLWIEQTEMLLASSLFVTWIDEKWIKSGARSLFVIIYQFHRRGKRLYVVANYALIQVIYIIK